MNPYDERQPEEQDPQYQELIILLQQAKLDPVLVDPQQRAQILSRARARLFSTDPEVFKEHMDKPALRESGSFVSKPAALADKPLHGRRLLHLLNMLAAVLVVTVLLGAPLLLFGSRLPFIRYHFTNGTGSYASFVAKNGIMFGFDAQHTNANPFEWILNPTTVGELKEKWVSKPGEQIVSSPTVTGDAVYVGSSDGIYALDAASGAKKWAFHTTRRVRSSPAVVGGVVYVGSSDDIYALDAASGAKKWAFHTSGPVESSPAVAGGVVYIGSPDGNVYALDAASGAKKWAFRTGSPVLASPAVAGGVVYIGSSDVYALDAASGAKKWAFRTGSSVDSSPAVAGGVVYVGSINSNLYAFHLPVT